jgi:translation initiation factor 1
MENICPKCGLNKEICVCRQISKEKQKIDIRRVERRYGKKMTLVKFSDSKGVDLKDLSKNLKSALACGGTLKNGVIELQGDHVERVKKELEKLGFAV